MNNINKPINKILEKIKHNDNILIFTIDNIKNNINTNIIYEQNRFK